MYGTVCKIMFWNCLTTCLDSLTMHSSLRTNCHVYVSSEKICHYRNIALTFAQKLFWIWERALCVISTQKTHTAIWNIPSKKHWLQLLRKASEIWVEKSKEDSIFSGNRKPKIGIGTKFLNDALRPATSDLVSCPIRTRSFAKGTSLRSLS